MPNVAMMTGEVVNIDIDGALDSFFNIATMGTDFVMSNPILSIVVIGSLAFMGLSFFGKAKKTARK